MWLSNYVTSNSKATPAAEKGSVSGAERGRVQVKASSDFRQLPILAPYGIAYVPPKGERTVVIPVGGIEMCAGVTAPQKDLQEGELMLCSKGGASIILKNDGSVYINGVKYD